jgi:hypothetical protein
MVVGRPTASNPKPIMGADDKWHARTVQIRKTTTGTAEVSFTLGDIVTAMTTQTGSQRFRVEKVKCWNTNLGGALRANLFGSIFQLVDSNDLGYAATDYGSGTSIAGVEFDIPDSLTKLVASAPGNSTSFMDVSNPNGATSTVYNHVAHVVLRFQQ